MVVTVAPSQDAASIVQDFTASPSTCTTQAPHWLVSQPTCVPVRRRFSRRNWTSSVRGSMSALTALAVDRHRHRNGPFTAAARRSPPINLLQLPSSGTFVTSCIPPNRSGVACFGFVIVLDYPPTWPRRDRTEDLSGRTEHVSVIAARQDTGPWARRVRSEYLPRPPRFARCVPSGTDARSNATGLARRTGRWSGPGDGGPRGGFRPVGPC